jgi:putative endopeptidase
MIEEANTVLFSTGSTMQGGSMKHLIFLSFLVSCAVMVSWAVFAVDSTAPSAAPPALDITDLDQTVKPGIDWYQYANGNWIKKNPIPDEYSRWGSFEKLRDENLASLRQILEQAAQTEATPGSIEQKIGDFYRSGMDTERIEKAGLEPLAADLGRIQRIRSKADVQRQLAYLHTTGADCLFNFYGAPDEKDSNRVITNLYQGGLGLPDREYYTSQEPRYLEMRQEYLNHLAKMFELAGDNAQQSTQNAGTVMKIEMRLAKASSTRLELRDPEKNYHKMTLQALSQLAGSFEWKNYFVDLGLKSPGGINVGQPQFIKEVGLMFKEVPVDDWKAYLRWHLLHEAAPYLNLAFELENFRFYGTYISGTKVMQPRWKRCIRSTSGAMGEALGELYVKEYFPPEAKTRMLELVINLKKALRERITQLEWMGPETKQQALIKLDAMNIKIGYPDKWRDYSRLEIKSDAYIANVLRASQFEFQRNLEKIGKPPDRTEWGMSPQTVNAYYDPSLNEIVFPAAILQPPFFNLHADDAVNYGAIGTVIGHEMTHGFDDQGRQYDAKGNLRDWWTAADAEAFKKRTAIIVKQFDAFEPLAGEHVNGELTLGENIADVGGITVAFLAYQKSLEGKQAPAKIDGFAAEQRFFLAFAHLWSENIRDKELLRRLKEDVHSPARCRAVGPLLHLSAFYDAFDIKPNEPLYRPESERARIW